MTSDVHLCKGTDVPNSNHLHCEVPEEVNDLKRFIPQVENEDEGCDDRTEQLLQDKHLIGQKNNTNYEALYTLPNMDRYLQHSGIKNPEVTLPDCIQFEF